MNIGKSLPIVTIAILLFLIVAVWMLIAYIGVGELGIEFADGTVYISQNDAFKRVYNPKWQNISANAQIASIKLSRKVSFPNYATLHILKINPKNAEFLVRYSKEYKRCKDIAQKIGLDVCINGSFFANSPLGLVISNGKQVAPPHRFMKGYFVVTKDNTATVLVGEEPNRENIKEAVQSFPALLKEGKVLVSSEKQVYKKSFNARFRANRSAIGTDDNGNIYLATITDKGMSFIEMAWVLHSIGIKTAFCLDGGGSAQLYVNTNKIKLDISGDPVPVIIGAKLTNRHSKKTNTTYKDKNP